MIDHAWSRATAGTEAPGALFATVTGGAVPDALIGVTSPVADRGVLHSMATIDGVMRMRPEPFLAVPAQGTLVLGPEGDHVMLMGLKHALAPGTRFPATFVFRGGEAVTVEVTVGGPGASGPP